MKKSTIVTIFLFLSIYIIGLFAANDYGISWDENTHRIFGQKTIVYIIKYFGFDHLITIPEGLNEFGSGGWAIKDYSTIFDGLSAVIEELYPIRS